MNEYFTDKQASDMLKKIFTPILLSLGLFGNIISMIIFNKPSMKKHSTFRYLTLLSVLDLSVLYTGCGQILLDVFFQIDVRSFSQITCKMHSFLVYFFTHFSSMLLAIMSIDRTVAILSKKGNKLSTPESALRIFYILGSIIAFINAHFLIHINLYEYDVPLIDQNSTMFFGSHLNPTIISTTLQNNETIIKIRFCYSQLNSTYFEYITEYFPW